VQYSYADADGILVAMPAPKVSETEDYISYSNNVFSSNRDNTISAKIKLSQLREK